MRLLDLDLLVFGPFSGSHLDLGREGVLHLIYGPNEAGKSTALRAITNLLYGIPPNTPDAHRHAMPDLRIGARLAASDGSVLHVVRRKGNKNTLLSPDDKPLPDDAIAALLGGVGEPLFRSMFGLDHVSLRDGAQALLHGRGSVGESLFAAGFGGLGVHAVLEQLEDEASDLFKPRAQNPKLNEAIKLFKEADKQSRDAATSAEAYRTQQDALRDAREENDTLAERRRELAAEQSRLQRALHVLPLLTRRNEYVVRRRALGEVAALPEDSERRRMAAQATIRECARDRERLIRETDALAQRLDGLQTPGSLVEIDERTIQELQDRLGSHRKAEGDLPNLRAELRTREEDALMIAVRLGHEVALEQIESLRIPAPQQAVIRKLAQERSGVETALVEASRALQQRRGARERQLAQLPPAPLSGVVQPLQRALTRARRLGDIDRAIEIATDEIARLERELEGKVDSLGFASQAPFALRGFSLPTADSVERFAARFEASDRESDESATRRRESEQRLRRVQRGLEELRLGGEVPSEEQLAEQRRQRDAAWRRIRDSWQAGQAASARESEDFEVDVRASDELADRLRREADRVAMRAKLGAELAECEEEIAAAERDIATSMSRREDLQGEWAALWRRTGIDPLGPAEMRTFLARAGAVSKLAEDLEPKRTALANQQEQRARHRSELGEILLDMGEPDGARIASFEGLLEFAGGILEERLAVAARITELNRAIDDADGEISDLERRHRECGRAAEAWSAAWEKSVAPLGLSAAAGAEEALAVLDDLVKMFAQVESIRQLRRRIMGIERDAAGFAELVSALVVNHASSLRGLSPTEAADQLLQAYQREQTNQSARHTIATDLEGKRAEQADCEELAQRATLEIEELLRLAKVESIEDLELAEQAVGSAAALDHQLVEIERGLYQAGEGATIEELTERSEGVDADLARSRLQEIEVEIEEAQERRAQLQQQIGSLEAGLKHLEAGNRAADAAVDAQEYLAAIKNNVSKYVRLRLAALLLRREIERYRERAQGPLLARATTLFPRLTLGRYTALRVGFDSGDEPVLRCVREDGSEVNVDGLSDGTRDQLYLALRVATLEHHAESNVALPIVLDDILIHFDDERAAAALGVLVELAQRTQILFFTHHRHLVDLARLKLPQHAYVEHALQRA